MRIVIDMQGMQTGSRHRGIGRYTLSLVQAMILNRREHEIILVLNGQFPETIDSIRASFDSLLPQENIRVFNALDNVAESFQKNTWRRKASELIREEFFASLEPDFILLTTLFEGYGDNFIASVGVLDQSTPVAIIVYDLIPLINTDTYLTDPYILAWYQHKVSHCKRAQLLLSISESSRQEALEHLEAKPDSVVNISSAVENTFQPIDLSVIQQNKIREKFGLLKEYLMYSGATDDRKNHLRLIKAYAQLPLAVRSQHQLVFVGGLPDEHRNKFLKESEQSGLKGGDLIITGRVSDGEMIALYNLCKAFVFPSWHEGFGLPALEAMSCGRAVIASNTSSLPEVVGDLEALFDPFDEQSIAAKIEQVLTDDNFRKRLEQHGLMMSKKFSWETTARKSINAIENCYEGLDYKQKTNDDILRKLLIERIAELSSPFNDHDLKGAAAAIAHNQHTNQKCQLLVDISELQQNDAGTGIQRVTRSILRELLITPPDGYEVRPVYATSTEGYRYAHQFTQRFIGGSASRFIDEPISYNENDVFLGLDLLPPLIASFNSDFYQAMRNCGVKVFFVIYDILPLLLPQYANDGVAKGHKDWLKEVAQNDGAICISQTVAEEVNAWFREFGSERIRPFKISWFHLGADIENSVPTQGMLDNSNIVLAALLERPSFLMVGTLEPRKRQEQTLNAFEQLWSDQLDVNLVIVGKPGWKVEEMMEKIRHHSELGKRLFLLEGVSDEYLEKVYSACTCLIAASEGEGFGLPLIEAAQHKLPIIARDIQVFREVAGKYAFFFANDKSPEVIANAVTDWLDLNAAGNAPMSDDMPWLTWKQSVNSLIDAIGLKPGNETKKPLTNSKYKPFLPEKKNLRYIFLHIEKTAGTSLVAYIKESVGEDEYYYTRPELLDDASKVKSDLSKYSALAGHINFDQIQRNFPDAFKITFLRHPVARVLSFYYFAKESEETLDPITVESKKLGILDFLDFCKDTNERRFVNGMTFKLASHGDKNNELTSAKNNLSKMDFVGIQEAFDESLAMLSFLTGWEPVERGEVANITQKKPDSGPGAEILDKILELNADDLSLYEYGVGLFADNRKKILINCVNKLN